MRLNPFRQRELLKNPWTIEETGDVSPPPIGLHPVLDMFALCHSVAKCQFELCMLFDAQSRMMMWISRAQSAVIVLTSGLNVYWAGRFAGWW
jgi:hypothetical protein